MSTLSSMTHDAFARRLSKLPMLHDVHFGSDIVKTSVQKQLDEELFIVGHAQHAGQMRHFKSGGEIAKLLKLCDTRFDSIFHNYAMSSGLLKNDGESLPAFLADDWFAFDPSAYALTYELENKDSEKGTSNYIVFLATPTLRGVYSNDVNFKDMDAVAAFLDSILMHEIAHCAGSMKHDAVFKNVFKSICSLENVKPII